MALKRTTTAMLTCGSLAGLLSGLLYPLTMGLRGAAFGFSLSLCVHLAGTFGWKRAYPYLPGLVLGTLLGLFPFKINIFDEQIPYAYDLISAINATLFIPLLASAYRSRTKKKRYGLLLLFGLISCLFRAYAMDDGPDAFFLVLFNFPAGMLPFLLLWTVAMHLTDPGMQQEI